MKRILAFLLAVLIISVTCVISASATEGITYDEYKYKNVILPLVFKDYELENPEFFIDYHEVYEYFSPDSIASSNETTPNYVLIYLSTSRGIDSFAAEVYGDYILDAGTSIGYPFAFDYGIYLPKSGEVLSLKKAHELGIEGFYNIFTEASIGRLIGDTDADRKLTVKDATHIQKCLSGMATFDKNDEIYAFSRNENAPLSHISDFNRDRERNVKDATAIQKHIAGLPQ